MSQCEWWKVFLIDECIFHVERFRVLNYKEENLAMLLFVISN
jgi:hypothetical protein